MKNVKLILRGYDGILATRLRDLMAGKKAKSKIKQDDLAKVLGIARQTISQYMDGSALPNTEKLYLISEYFNVSIDYLLGKTDIKSYDINDRAIHTVTGLNQASIDKLKKWKKESAIHFHYKGLLESINIFLSDEKTESLFNDTYAYIRYLQECGLVGENIQELIFLKMLKIVLLEKKQNIFDSFRKPIPEPVPFVKERSK